MGCVEGDFFEGMEATAGDGFVMKVGVDTELGYTYLQGVFRCY